MFLPSTGQQTETSASSPGQAPSLPVSNVLLSLDSGCQWILAPLWARCTHLPSRWDRLQQATLWFDLDRDCLISDNTTPPSRELLVGPLCYCLGLWSMPDVPEVLGPCYLSARSGTVPALSWQLTLAGVLCCLWPLVSECSLSSPWASRWEPPHLPSAGVQYHGGYCSRHTHRELQVRG